MSKQRVWMLGAVTGLLSLAAVVAVTTATAGKKTTTAQGAVSGKIAVMAVWTGAEQKSFQAVIDGFKKLNPGVSVGYTSAGDQLPTVLATAIQGGNPPDVAVLPQPGLVRDFVNKGALKPISFALADAEGELRSGLDEARHGQRQALRPDLQGRQQVDRLVQRRGRSRTPGSRLRRHGLSWPRPRRRCVPPARRRTRSAARTAGR